MPEKDERAEVEPQIGVPPLSKRSKKYIENLFKRAAKDIKLRETLLNDPEKVLARAPLTQFEKDVLSSMKRVPLEQWGVDIRPIRAILRDNGSKLSAYSAFGAGLSRIEGLTDKPPAKKP